MITIILMIMTNGTLGDNVPKECLYLPLSETKTLERRELVL